MSIDGLYELVRSDLNNLDLVIKNELKAEVGFIDELSHHIIHSGGKRLRPLTVILCARACGYEGDEHVALAASMEFFHNATLLHDDVVDESDMRRGRKTANHIWGSKPSVLVGDFLFTRAFQVMLGTSNTRIMRLLADTANVITQGEVLQLLNCHNPETTEDAYLAVIERKTAALFAAAAQIGAILTAVNETWIQKLANYGLYLGNAFQIIDDALDYCSDLTVMGKNMGDDLAEGKPTLPFIYAMTKANPEQKAVMISAIKNGKTEHFAQIKKAIIDTKAIEYTYQVAQLQIDKALQMLEILPDTVYRQALIDLALFSVQRDH